MPDRRDPPTPHEVWLDALAEVDRAFAEPPALDRPVGGCTLCMSEEDLHRMGGPPDAVPDELLGHFLREVYGHWDADQYPVLWRRFMPRALRVWARPSGNDLADEMGRLQAVRGAGLVDWPPRERAAVERAFGALLTVALTDGRPAREIAELVEGIAHATGALEPWLGHLAGSSGPQAEAGLVRLVLDWSCDLLWDEFTFRWWHDGDPQVIRDWLPTLRPRVALFAARHPRCKTASDALHALASLQAADYGPWLYPYGLKALLPQI